VKIQYLGYRWLPFKQVRRSNSSEHYLLDPNPTMQNGGTETSVEIALSPMQTHEARDVYQQSVVTKTVQTHRLKGLGYVLTALYLCLLIIQPSISNCFRKFLGTLVFGIIVSLMLLIVYTTEEMFSRDFKRIRQDADGNRSRVEAETISFETRIKIFLVTFMVSMLLTFPLDYAVFPSVRSKIDCQRPHVTNGVKLTGVFLMIINMSVLLGRIAIIKLTSLECLRYVSLRKVRLLKRVSVRVNAAELGAALNGAAEGEGSTRLTFLQPKQADDEDDEIHFFKALIASHNKIVAANSSHIMCLMALFVAQLGYCVNTYYHEHVLGPNDVQQLMITFLLLSILALSLMVRLSYMSKIYENEAIVNEEAAAVEALSAEQVQMVLVTSVTVLSAIVGRAITFLNDSGGGSYE
jgi:hypothetical protein